MLSALKWTALAVLMGFLAFTIHAQSSTADLSRNLKRPAALQSGTSRPLFTDFPSQRICSDSSFVAMSSGNLPSGLVIVRIGRMGIEEPQKIPVEYHDIYGMKCNHERVELLVQAEGAHNFSRLPFSINESGIKQENPIAIDYSTLPKGPMPVEVQDFHKVELLPMGDWRIEVPAFPRFNIKYELHFTRTRRRTAEGLATSLSVDLLDETLDGKINKTVPLIRYVHTEYAE